MRVRGELGAECVPSAPCTSQLRAEQIGAPWAAVDVDASLHHRPLTPAGGAPLRCLVLVGWRRCPPTLRSPLPVSSAAHLGTVPNFSRREVTSVGGYAVWDVGRPQQEVRGPQAPWSP